MERKIKFRAWDAQARCMLGGGGMQINATTGRLDHLPSVVPMLYTGRKDKQGKEIYEGDLLTYPGHKGYYRIQWVCDGEDCGFECVRDKPYNYMLPCVWEKMEVAGNIYKHPGLLKGNEIGKGGE